jgi:hypothetical protein
MTNWNKAILLTIANLAIIFAGIQLAPLILPASSNPILAFGIPVVALVLAFILLAIEQD